MNIIEQNNKKIKGKTETFDRVIINGYLRELISTSGFGYYLNQNNIMLKDFNKYAESETKELCENIEKYIESQDVTLTYLSSPKINKDEEANKIFKQVPNKIGLIAAFSTVELCKTSTVLKNHNTCKLEVGHKDTKCKFFYLYFNDKEFGWMFLKIQTWFPYNVQIYFNGHERLSKLLDKNNIKYAMFNNSFSDIEDFDKAQGLADKILNEKISSSFDGIVKQINCHLPKIEKILGCSYYWCIDQCEFATDITFNSRNDLIFFKKLVETTFYSFSSNDGYSFFGRNIKDINKFKGEITSDIKNRYQGYRIKFKMNKNQVKMYDKGNNLRIEVTINNPREFKALKEVESKVGDKTIVEKKWVPMGKSIANLYRYAEISKSIINRFIDALPNIDNDTVPLKEIQKISERTEINGRKYSSFNILNKDTLELFNVIGNGCYLINGFSNKLIRKELMIKDDDKKSINKLTRILAKLKAHGIIKKVHKKNKYYLTVNGRAIINSILIYTKRDLLNQ